MAVVPNNTLLPGDPRLIDHIVCELKSQGIFDQFRKECISDVDTKPAYQNLRQRVEGSVSGFLKTQIWKPDMNKNQLREALRKNIYESGFLETGVERIVDQVVNPKINTVFLPQVEEVVYKFLGLEKPSKIKNTNGPLSINTMDLLPTDLDPISPDTEILDKTMNKTDKNNELDNSKIEEDESPPFEPIVEKMDECSNDSKISGISGLTSHDSNLTDKDMKIDTNNPDSQLSKVSSNSRLSIITLDSKNIPEKMDISDESKSSSPQIFSFEKLSQNGFGNIQQEIKDELAAIQNEINNPKPEIDQTDQKPEIPDEKMETSEVKPVQNQDIINILKNDDIKPDEQPETVDETVDENLKKVDQKPDEIKDEKKSENKEKSERHRSDSERRRDKEKKSDKEKDKKYSTSKSSSKEKDRNRDKSKDSRSKDKDKKESKKDDKRSSSSSKHSSRDRSKSDSKNESKNDSKSESKSSSKDKKDKKDESRSKSDSKSSKTDSKSSSRSRDHSKSDSKSKDRKSSSSRDHRDKKDPKKSKKDDHNSSKDKKDNRRSADRDSNDGSSGPNMSASKDTKENHSSTSSKKNSDNDSTPNSNSENSGQSDNSQGSQPVEKSPKIVDLNEKSPELLLTIKEEDIKIKKPKIASNIFEARKLMKIRKKLEKLERKRQKQYEKSQIGQNLDSFNKDSESLEDTDSMDSGKLQIVEHEDREKTENKTDESNKTNAVISKANWDAIESKLSATVNQNIDFDSYIDENNDSSNSLDQNESKCSKRASEDEDCLYFNNQVSPSTERFLKSVETFRKTSKVPEENKMAPPNKRVKKNSDEVKKTNVKRKQTKGKKRKISDDYILDNNNKKINNSYNVVEIAEEYDDLQPSPSASNTSNGSIDNKKSRKKKKNSDFPLPLSPDSDISGDKPETTPVVKNRAPSSKSQRYSSDDLYKPRPFVSGSSRRQRGLLNNADRK